MSKLRNRILCATAAPAGILALTFAAACNRDAENVGMEGEPPPEIEEAPAQGDDPYAQGDDPHAATDPAGGAPPAGEAPPMGGEGQPGMAGEVPQGEPVSDEDLEAFAAAYLEVEDVQQELEAELHAAESNEQAQEIQQRAINEIRDAVEETGMDFESYGMIAQRLQQDPELIERVEETIETMRN